MEEDSDAEAWWENKMSAEDEMFDISAVNGHELKQLREIVEDRGAEVGCSPRITNQLGHELATE